jgi:hypothetical protein
VILSFAVDQQLGDVVVAESIAQAQGARHGAVGLRWGGLQHGVESDAKGGVDDFFERFPEAGRALPGLGRHIGIERQGGSHTGIMMLYPALSMGRLVFRGPMSFASLSILAASIRRKFGLKGSGRS